MHLKPYTNPIDDGATIVWHLHAHLGPFDSTNALTNSTDIIFGRVLLAAPKRCVEELSARIYLENK